MMASVEEICRIYEKPLLREVGGGLIRPGGLALTQRAFAVCKLARGSRVLDMGCGTGVTLKYLRETRGFRAVGIDASPVLPAEGHRKSPDLPLARATGAHLPFADRSMDAILAECSLSVMEDVDAALDECSRVLKHLGVLLMHDVYARSPDAGASLRELPLRCCLTGAVSKEEWIERLERRGLSVTVWEDHSNALKEFAARLIFSHGSLESFWNCSGSMPPVGGGGEIQQVISSAKPGYFLVMARKFNMESFWGRKRDR